MSGRSYNIFCYPNTQPMCLKSTINMAYIIKIGELPKDFKKLYLNKTNFPSWVNRLRIKLGANQYAYSKSLQNQTALKKK